MTSLEKLLRMIQRDIYKPIEFHRIEFCGEKIAPQNFVKVN